MLLLAGIGGMVWYFASQEKEAARGEVPADDPLLGLGVTASQRATFKYFFVVAALIVVQIGLGVVAAHYGVEGNGLYGIPLARWLPYSVVRTWHTQIGLFWIATSWLATGLFIAPAVSGCEPKRQRLGVNLLFAALLFVVVAFWNFVGAGLFGFLINPPVALYYMQGLNTTPVHGHTALFGVYGMLGIGLMLFSLRALRNGRAWKEWPLRCSFWLINGGLALMVLLSLLPIGLMQTWASVEYGTWYARSAEFLQTGLMNDLRWMRAVGDSTFALGALILGYFVLGLITGRSYTKGEPVSADEPVLAPPRREAHATAAD